jgi:hypothetical protein
MRSLIAFIGADMVNTDMRYPLPLVILLCLACSKSEAPPSAATEAEPKVAAAPTQASPSVELVTAGEPPRRALRWHFEKGSKETLEIKSKRKSIRGGGESPAPEAFDIPEVIFEVAVETREVTLNGTAQVEFEVLSAGAPEAPIRYSPQVVKALRESVGRAKGTTGTYSIDSRGVVGDVQLVPESVRDDGVETVLRRLLAWTTMPLPEEAVGRDGKWIITREIERGGTRVSEVSRVKLAKIEGSRIDLDVKIDGASPEQGLSKGPGVSPRGSATGPRLELEGIQRFEGDLTKLVPQSSRIESTTKTTVLVRGSDGRAKQSESRVHSIDTLSAKDE